MKLSAIWNIFKSKEYVFHTELSVEECIKLLKHSIIEEDFYWEYEKSKSFIGNISGNRFWFANWSSSWVFSNLRIFTSTSRDVSFHGEFIPHENGTNVVGHFSIISERNIFILLIVFLLLTVLSLFISPKYLSLASPKYPFPLILFLFALNFLVWFLVIRVINRGMKDNIFKLFKTTLKATPLFPSEPPSYDLPDKSEKPF